MRHSTLVRLLSVLFVAGLVSACGARTTALVSDVDAATAATAEGDFEALVQAGWDAWAERSSIESTRAAIAAWEEASTVETPEGVSRREALFPVLHMLSRAYYWYGDFHLQYADAVENRNDQRHAAYTRGMEVGRTAIALNNTAWTETLQAGERIRDAAAHLMMDDIDAAYWYAVNISRWALMEGTPTILRNTPDIRAVMERVRELDEDYFYGAANRYFGVFHTRLPLGNPDRDLARENFEQAIERFPQYLDNRYLFVMDWAAPRNREIAEEQLQAIMDFDLDSAPEIRPENEASQHKARLVLEDLDRYFR